MPQLFPCINAVLQHDENFFFHISWRPLAMTIRKRCTSNSTGFALLKHGHAYAANQYPPTDKHSFQRKHGPAIPLPSASTLQPGSRNVDANPLNQYWRRVGIDRRGPSPPTGGGGGDASADTASLTTGPEDDAIRGIRRGRARQAVRRVTPAWLRRGGPTYRRSSRGRPERTASAAHRPTTQHCHRWKNSAGLNGLRPDTQQKPGQLQLCAKAANAVAVQRAMCV